MQLFDTHFHFYGENSVHEYVSAVNEALTHPKQLEAGRVERVFYNAVGANFAESWKAQEFASAVPDSVFSCGVHPHSAEEYLQSGDDFTVFKNAPHLVAVGELGLDYFYDYSDHEAQKKVFARFLELALEWKLPAIIHLRDKDDCFEAYCDGYELLKDFSASGGRFVVHCFAGNPGWAEKFLSLGAYLGVTGMVTFKKAENIRVNLKSIPLDRLLIETDSPYLAPVPHRGKENHPGYLIHVAAATAKEYGISTAELAGITTANGRRFFNI